MDKGPDQSNYASDFLPPAPLRLRLVNTPPEQLEDSDQYLHFPSHFDPGPELYVDRGFESWEDVARFMLKYASMHHFTVHIKSTEVRELVSNDRSDPENIFTRRYICSCPGKARQTRKSNYSTTKWTRSCTFAATFRRDSMNLDPPEGYLPIRLTHLNPHHTHSMDLLTNFTDISSQDAQSSDASEWAGSLQVGMEFTSWQQAHQVITRTAFVNKFALVIKATLYRKPEKTWTERMIRSRRYQCSCSGELRKKRKYQTPNDTVMVSSCPYSLTLQASDNNLIRITFIGENHNHALELSPHVLSKSRIYRRSVAGLCEPAADIPKPFPITRKTASSDITRGMSFESWDSAHAYLLHYALKNKFNICIKLTKYKTKDQRKPGTEMQHQDIESRRYCCSRHGKPRKAGSQRRRTRGSLRCSCPYSIVLNAKNDNSGFVQVTFVREAHNHELLSEAQVQACLTNRHQVKAYKNEVETLAATDLAPKVLLQVLRVKFPNLELTYKDVYNDLASLRQSLAKSTHSDAHDDERDVQDGIEHHVHLEEVLEDPHDNTLMYPEPYSSSKAPGALLREEEVASDPYPLIASDLVLDYNTSRTLTTSNAKLQEFLTIAKQAYDSVDSMEYQQLVQYLHQLSQSNPEQ